MKFAEQFPEIPFGTPLYVVTEQPGRNQVIHVTENQFKQRVPYLRIQLEDKTRHWIRFHNREKYKILGYITQDRRCQIDL